MIECRYYFKVLPKFCGDLELKEVSFSAMYLKTNEQFFQNIYYREAQ